jgi:hypothetical protein
MNYVLLDLSKLETVQCVTTSLRALHQRLTGQNGRKRERDIVETTPKQVFAYALYALKNPDKSLNSVNVEYLVSECRDFYRGFISSQD